MVATVVEKEIAFALENQALPQERMEGMIGEVARRFHIGHLLPRLTGELSGGEKQRVALASIMVQDPPVLVLDEPDTFLDEAGRRLLQDELGRLHRNSPELVEIRITQNPAVAVAYRRLVVLDGGAVVFDGSPEAFFADFSRASAVGLAASSSTVEKLDLPSFFGGFASRKASRVDSIRAEAVAFAYPGGGTVLEGADLLLGSGEIVALVGPTGIGKSSLGLLICGILAPTGGSIAYLGADGAVLKPEARRGQVVALLQQPERQFFLPSCTEEIAFGPSNFGLPLAAEAIDACLSLVGLAPGQFRSRDPFTLSGGEKRRLAFAVVLSLAPSYVVFDEPTAGLDPEGIARFIAISGALKRRGVGQLLISHDGGLVSRLADRVLYLNNTGKLVKLTVNDLLGRPEYAGVVSSPALSNS